LVEAGSYFKFKAKHEYEKFTQAGQALFAGFFCYDKNHDKE
jgi:hypothetical protein